MKIRKVWSERFHEWGFKADFGLGKGKDRRRVRLPTEGVFASEEHCWRAYRQAKAEFARDEFLFPADRQEVTVRLIFDKRLAKHAEFNRSPDHVAMTARAFEAFGLVLSLDSQADEIKSEHLGNFFKLRQAQGAAQTTAFKELRQIMAALTFELGHAAPKKPEWVKRGENKTKRAITPEEETKILDDLRAHGETNMAHLFIIGIGTGMRKGEIFRIDRADVLDEPGEKTPYGTLTAKATKTGDFRLTGETQDRTIPMSRRVREVLDARRANWDPLVSVSMPQAGLLFSKFDYKKKLKESCNRVGVPYGRHVGITFKSTRDTFVSRLNRKGVSLATIGRLTGQKKIATTSDYAHATAADLGGAIELLDDSGDGQ